MSNTYSRICLRKIQLMGILFEASDCVKPMRIFNSSVMLLSFPLKQQSGSGKLNYTSPDFPQLYQVHCIVLLYFIGISSTVCCPCYIRLTLNMPQPSLPPQLPRSYPIFPLAPSIWSDMWINRSKVPDWEVGHSSLLTYEAFYSPLISGSSRKITDLLSRNIPLYFSSSLFTSLRVGSSPTLSMISLMHHMCLPPDISRVWTLA